MKCNCTVKKRFHSTLVTNTFSRNQRHQSVGFSGCGRIWVFSGYLRLVTGDTLKFDRLQLFEFRIFVASECLSVSKFCSVTITASDFGRKKQNALPLASFNNLRAWGSVRRISFSKSSPATPPLRFVDASVPSSNDVFCSATFTSFAFWNCTSHDITHL